MGSVPVTPVVSGSPVAFVSTHDDGVPRAGVTSVGEVANTNAPLPVSSEICPATPDDTVVPVNAEVPLPISSPVSVPAPLPPFATVSGEERVSPANVGEEAVVRFCPVLNASCVSPMLSATMSSANAPPRAYLFAVALICDDPEIVPVATLVSVFPFTTYATCTVVHGEAVH